MEIITIIACLIALIAFVFIGVDSYVNFHTWQARIRMGRIKNTDTYTQKVMQRSQQWLTKTPTVKLTDNNRLVLIDILKGNYKRTAIQHWQKAGLILGLKPNNTMPSSVNISQLLQATHPQNIPEESDYVIYAYALLNGASPSERIHYRPYFDAVYHMLLRLKGRHQVIAYKKFTGSQMYVDTIGFVCPFLALYAKTYQDQLALDLAINQIRQFNKWGMFPGTSLPCHTYNEENQLHAGLFGWGRGMGWYAIGLIDVWQLLKPEDPEYAEVTVWVLSFAQTIMQFQRDKGSFGWHVLSESAIADSSTVVMLTWFLTLASSIPEIHAQCTVAIEKSINYLQSVTRRDGTLDFCQGDTKGIGIYSQTFDRLPFAQGYLLRILQHKSALS